jgi:hypothetical protein
LLVEATVPNTHELRAFLLRTAADVEVLEPPELREEMRAIGRALVANHAVRSDEANDAEIPRDEGGARSQVTSGVTTPR